MIQLTGTNCPVSGQGKMNVVKKTTSQTSRLSPSLTRCSRVQTSFYWSQSRIQSSSLYLPIHLCGGGCGWLAGRQAGWQAPIAPARPACSLALACWLRSWDLPTKCKYVACSYLSPFQRKEMGSHSALKPRWACQ